MGLVTAHGGFDKACFYLDVEFRKVELTSDFKVDIYSFSKYIDKNTICLIGSAPDYAFGLIDPIP